MFIIAKKLFAMNDLEREKRRACHPDRRPPVPIGDVALEITFKVSCCLSNSNRYTQTVRVTVALVQDESSRLAATGLLISLS